VTGVHRLFVNAQLVRCDAAMSVEHADLRVVDGVIAEIGRDLERDDAEVVDLSGRWLMPGFVQSHVHLCQTLFRGLADDLQLLDWLRTRIWPLEASHDDDSMYWSARLGVSELLLGGTTAILDMGTARSVDPLFTACGEAGLRAFIGRALMDRDNEAGLSQPTEAALQAACDEADRHAHHARQGYAFAPRFVPSCTEELLRQVVVEARRRGCLIHSHASENRAEVELVRELTGRDNLVYLHGLGMSGPDVALAHCVHVTDEEVELLAETGTRVLHCPSSNLKLGSGICPVPELVEAGVHVSIGADGAPCNNRLDAFTEVRTAALVQKPRLGADAMPAALALALATRHGAEALGLPAGELSVGKLADLVVLDADDLAALPGHDPMSTIVYAMRPASVQSTWIAGECVARDGRVVGWDRADTVAGVRNALGRVLERVGL